MNDLIILALLMDGPKYGYQLKREAGFIFDQGSLHNNLIYPLLRRFTTSGWVTKKAIPGERGQTRQEYSITALGRKTLLDKVRAYEEADAPHRSAFMVRVGMFAFLSELERKRILDLREAHLRIRMQTLAGLEKRMELGRYAESTVRHLAAQIKIELAWIRELRQLDHSERPSHSSMAKGELQ